MTYDVTLSTKISRPVARRLRTLSALDNRPLTQLVDELLGRGLPSAEELALRVVDSDDCAFAPEAGADTTPDTQKAGTAISPAVPAHISASAA